ncbi:MAG: hypothetical protein LBB60_06485 [Desulfovibrio sp.]|jgi:hypothetical protein|nr:hypothetical protein [Desulfovibrio sp.]
MPSTPVTQKNDEVRTAKKQGVDGKTSRKTQILVSGPYMEILIGGPYTKSNREEVTYGHTALRVVVDGTDTTYDFGRYGREWGPFDSRGEGILKVWNDFSSFIAGENAYGRQTVGFVYPLEQEEARKIHGFFTGLICSAENRKSMANAKVYRLQQNYHATSYNCTTITIDGAQQTGKQIVYNPEAHAKRQGLTFIEDMAATGQSRPVHGIFMPADLRSMLEANTVCPYTKKNIYGQKR